MSATPSAIRLRGAYMYCATLRGAKMRGANLEGATLRGADLGGALLAHATLYGADLRGAMLDGADLTRADLRCADLRGADLTRAALYVADLSAANLEGAHLENADLAGATLTDARLAAARLTGADLRGARLPEGIPVVPRIDAAILEACGHDGSRLDPHGWHSACGMKHNRAAWAIVLAGDAGRMLEERLGIWTAAALIYAASVPGGCIIPDWSLPHEATLADLRQRAAEAAGDAG